ncbi:hypothetical protein HQ590_14990, partial [bacterium]|nr:hypothetical protein [bacterium]
DTAPDKLVVTGTLVATNDLPLAGHEVVVKGILKKYDDGGVGRFWSRTDSNGVFRIEIDRSRVTNEAAGVTLEGGKPDPKSSLVQTELLRKATGGILMLNLDPPQDKLDVGRVSLTQPERGR